MDTVKAKFKFVSEAGADGKTTIVSVKTIQLTGQSEVYVFPPNLQTNTSHVQLFNNSVVKNVVKSLRTRNKYRNVIITLTEELVAIYLDEEGNVVFHDLYLEELSTETISSGAPPTSKPSRTLAKDMVLEKFTGDNFNANSWLKVFIRECTRVGITEERYVETLRLFLDKSALEWFIIFEKNNSLINNWGVWSNSFLDTFSVQSWSEVAYALNFKYLSGSLLEFALKKRRLILETDEKMSLATQLNLIVVSLPKSIQNKLDKKGLSNAEDLMSRLKQLGHTSEKENKKTPASSFCKFCESLGFANRSHDESVCRLKKGKSNEKNNKIRMANNTEAQDIISMADEAKNS